MSHLSSTRTARTPSALRAAGPPTRAVLVTGVSRHLGARLVHALQDQPGVRRVIGVDRTPPPTSLGSAEFVQSDIRAADVGEIITSGEIDTVVHLDLRTSVEGGRGEAKETNVIGTMQLLAACQRAAALRRLVVRSSWAVYGGSPSDPAVFAEDDAPVAPPRSGYAKDVAEVEGYVAATARRRADVTVSVLRFAGFVGPSVDSPLTRYFQAPLVPTVLGYDPRLQFLHEDDAVEVLRRMTLGNHPGTYNVAGAGVMTLSQAIRMAGRTPVPLPRVALRSASDAGRRFGVSAEVPPELLALLRYGRVLDTSKLVTELDWRPRYGSKAAFADFVRARGLGHGGPLELFDRLAGGLDMTPPSGTGRAGGR